MFKFWSKPNYPVGTTVFDKKNNAWLVVTHTSSAIVLQLVGTSQYRAVTVGQLEDSYSEAPQSGV